MNTPGSLQDHPVQTFYNWIFTTYENGICPTNEICKFHEKNRNAGKKLKKKYSNLSILCKKYPHLFQYDKKGTASKLIIHRRQEGKFSIGNELPCLVHVKAPLPWDSQPCIEENIITKFENAHVEVNSEYHGNNKLECFLLREKRKSISADNLIKLQKNLQQIQDLQYSDKTLRQIAHELNMAYSDAAIGLLGMDLINSEMDESVKTPDSNNRIECLLKETLQLAAEDKISGYKISSHVKSALRATANDSEQTLLNDLKKHLGITANDYKTEQDIKNEAEEGQYTITPDILFNDAQIILDKECKWIEVKNAVLIPGITPKETIEQLKKQICRYVETYGPGIIYWKKCGFAQRVVDELPNEVLHVVPNKVATSTRHQANAVMHPRQPRYSYPNDFFGIKRFPEHLVNGHFMSFNDRPLERKKYFCGFAYTLGGDELDIKEGRSRYLDKLEEQFKTAHGSLDEDTDDYATFLCQMFQVDTLDEEERYKKLLQTLRFQIKLIELTETAAQSFKTLNKIVDNIVNNPGDEKFLKVKVVPSISSNDALKFLKTVGMELELPSGETTNKYLKYNGEYNHRHWKDVHNALVPYI